MSSGSVVTSKVSPYFCTRVKVSDGYMPRWYKMLLTPNAENERNRAVNTYSRFQVFQKAELTQNDTGKPSTQQCQLSRHRSLSANTHVLSGCQHRPRLSKREWHDAPGKAPPFSATARTSRRPGGGSALARPRSRPGRSPAAFKTHKKTRPRSPRSRAGWCLALGRAAAPSLDLTETAVSLTAHRALPAQLLQLFPATRFKNNYAARGALRAQAQCPASPTYTAGFRPRPRPINASFLPKPAPYFRFPP